MFRKYGLQTAVTIMLLTMAYYLTACASIESKCLNEANSPNVSEAMRSDYFNSCVESRRQRAKSWGNMLGKPSKQVICSGTQFGNNVNMDCE